MISVTFLSANQDRPTTVVCDSGIFSRQHWGSFHLYSNRLEFLLSENLRFASAWFLFSVFCRADVRARSVTPAERWLLTPWRHHCMSPSCCISIIIWCYDGQTLQIIASSLILLHLQRHGGGRWWGSCVFDQNHRVHLLSVTFVLLWAYVDMCRVFNSFQFI